MRAVVASCAVLVAGCSATPVKTDPATVQAVSSIASTVALPAYAAFTAAATALAQSTDALASTPPDATMLATVRSDWKAARVALRKTDALAFGPIEDLRISDAVDFWPANTATIETFISGSTGIDAAAVDELGANAKGFAAIEALIFTDDDTALLLKLEGEQRRRALIKELGAAIAREALRLEAAWEGESGAAYLLAHPGPGNLTYPTSKAAVDAVVNQSFFVGDLIANGVIGRPFGKRNGGTIDPSQERSRRSANTLAELRASIDSMKAVYDGGLGTLVISRSAEADAAVKASFEAAYARLDEVPETFTHSMTQRSSAVESLYRATRDLKNTYGAELATALGVTLRFSDNDGD